MRTLLTVVLAILLPPLASGDVASSRPLDLSELNLPPGFEISIYAQGLGNARMLAFSPSGLLFVSDTGGGRILVVPSTGRVEIFAAGRLSRPAERELSGDSQRLVSEWDINDAARDDRGRRLLQGKY